MINIKNNHDELLKELLREKIRTCGDEESYYYLVSKDYYDYKSGGIYYRLDVQSNIHPSQYKGLTWRELWEEIYGVCDL